MHKYPLILACTMTICAFLAANSIFAVDAGNQLPEDIRARLEANATLLDPIQLVWKQLRKSTMEESLLMQQIKYPDYAKIDFFTEATFTYHLQDGMVYEFFQSSKADRIPKSPQEKVKVVPFESEAAFDLTKVYNGTAEAGRRAAGKYPLLNVDRFDAPKMHEPDDQIFKATYLREAGYYPPSLFKELGGTPRHIVLQLFDSGAKLASVGHALIDGTDCFQLTLDDSRNTYSFVLDPKKAYALRRRTDVLKSTGETTRIANCEDFKMVREPSLWLPQKCQIKYFTWETILPKISHDPIVTETVTLDSVATSRVPKDKFALAYKTPGSYVCDSTLDEAAKTPKGIVNYRIPAQPGDLAAAIAAASKEVKRPISTRMIFIVMNLALIFLLISGILWRRWQRS